MKRYIAVIFGLSIVIGGSYAVATIPALPGKRWTSNKDNNEYYLHTNCS